MEKTKNTKKLLVRMTLTAVFLALALALKALSTFYIPLFGANGIRVGLSGIFTTLPALLFGPLYGGFASAASDMLGTFINPSGGGWIPWFTLVAFMGGFVKGLIFKAVRRVNAKYFKAFALVMLALVMLSGVVSHLMLYNDGVMHSLVATTDSMGSQSELYTRYYNGELSPLGRVIYKRTLSNKNVFTTANSQDGFKMKYLELYRINKDLQTYVALTPSGAKLGETTYKAIYAERFGAERVYLIAKYNENEKTLEILPLSAASALERDFGRAVSAYFGEEGATLTDLAMPYDSLATVSDTYRKNAANYANVLTVCLEGAALFGLLIVAADGISRRIMKAKGKESSEFTMPIFFAVVASGILVTTVNTQVLRMLYANYSDLAFLVFFLPRLTEELIVCTVQTYVIALLYGVFRSTVPQKLYE